MKTLREFLVDSLSNDALGDENFQEVTVGLLYLIVWALIYIGDCIKEK